MANDCWAKIDKSEGSLDTDLNIYFDKNDTGENRSVKIRVTSPDGTIKKEYTLVQGEATVETFYNERQSQSFTKQGCDSTNERGEVIEYVVPAGKYSSTISVADANRKALADIEANGQAYANEHGECITTVWYNTIQVGEFQKNDCNHDTEEGSTVTYVIAAGSYSSTISQEDADRKAKEALKAGGQDYANRYGHCVPIKWYNTEMSQQFQKNDCLATEVGSMVTYTVPAGKYTSTISQEDANEKARRDIAENGQDYANEHGTCATDIWYNEEQKKMFTRNNCEDGKIGTDYEYVVPAGKYSSTVSQQDANNKALADIEENGQDMANLEGECIDDPNYFVGKASHVFTKEGCDPESEYGSNVTVTQDDVEGGPFISRVSQEEADELAMAAVMEQGQDIANERGECISKDAYTGKFSKEFTKNNCADGGTGSKVTITQDDVTGGPFISYESQTAANALAQAAVEEQGQAVANTKGSCTWTGSYEQQFVKNDCEEGQQGSSMTVSDEDCVGYPFTSNVSQEDADNKAKEAVEAQGQGIVNAQGTCNDLTVYTGNYSKNFTPECDHCEEGVEMEVTATMVNGSPVISYVSQDEADQEAKRIVEEGGQAYANKNGQCNPMSTDADWQNVSPEETECQEGKSMIKQQDMNECSPTYNQTKWVEGGGLTCSWNGKASQEFQKNDCPEGEEAGTMVTVTEADMASIEESGYPFTSFESQEAADDLAEAAVAQYGQQVANEKGSCNECGFYKKKFYRNDCGSCMEDLVGIEVTSDMVGGPFCDPDPEVAQQKAQQAVEENGQAYVNKNGPECTPMSTDPVWVDSDPLETECRDGVSYKKQVNTNDCYSGEQEQWIPGGGLTCEWTAPDSSEEYTRTCDHDGEGGTVTVQSSELPGYPFKSTVSEDDAIRIRDAAFAEHGEEVASGKPGWTCLWTATYSKQITRSDCGTCDKGTTVNVSSDQCGGPFTSNISYDDALSKAKNAVEEMGQSVANKNGDCVNDPDKDYASWSDTGTTQCSGCTSQKQQRDTNQCSPTYNSTQWVNGGSRDCTENGSWGSWSGWSCSGCTATRTRTNTCGATEHDTEYNSDHCGSWGSWSYTGSCSGSQSQKKRTHSCTGEVEYDYDYRECYCGYGGGDYNTAVGSATCRRGVSQRQYRDSCGDTIWRNEGSACTASYNCSNISATSGSEGSCTYRCVYSGTQSASGSTTSAAESAARAKCTCSKTYSYTRSCSGSCSGSEDGCTYSGTYTGGGTGTGSSCSAAQSNAAACTCGGKTYSYIQTQAPSNSDCSWACKNEGYDTGTSKNNSLSGTGSGSSCSTAKSNAISAWNDKFNGAVTTYCNCENNKTWSASVTSSTTVGSGMCSGIRYNYTYNNQCGANKIATFTWRTTNSPSSSYPSTGIAQCYVPSGSGSSSGTVTLQHDYPCNSLSVSGSDGGSC